MTEPTNAEFRAMAGLPPEDDDSPVRDPPGIHFRMPGRHRSVNPHRQPMKPLLSLSMDDVRVAKATALGHGNFSAGIVSALKTVQREPEAARRWLHPRYLQGRSKEGRFWPGALYKLSASGVTAELRTVAETLAADILCKTTVNRGVCVAIDYATRDTSTEWLDK